MERYGLDKLIHGLCDRIAAEVRVIDANFDKAARVDSPIEKLLATALYFRTKYLPFNAYAFDQVIFAEIWPSQNLDDAMVIHPQAPVLNYRADFLVAIGAYPERKFVVECDGHNFHERTKEQASRDRARDRTMQTSGLVVLRFTGSEIFRDPLRCAEEVLEHATNLFWDAEFSGGRS